jgi:hypothetical protein
MAERQRGSRAESSQAPLRRGIEAPGLRVSQAPLRRGSEGSFRTSCGPAGRAFRTDAALPEGDSGGRWPQAIWASGAEEGKPGPLLRVS